MNYFYALQTMLYNKRGATCVFKNLPNDGYVFIHR